MRIWLFVTGLGVLLGTQPSPSPGIMEAIRSGDVDSVSRIIEKDPQAVQQRDKSLRTPLHEAAEQGRLEITSLLIEAGAPLSPADDQGFTPLHRAVFKGHPGVAKLLISRGAGVDLRTRRGRTPLTLVAMSNGRTDLAELLIDAGASVDPVENTGGTPLTYAAFRGFNELVNDLLDHGAEVQTDSELWFEVFHRACAHGQVRLAEVMISRGLDVASRNEDGKNALHSAAEGGSVELVVLLIDRGLPPTSLDYGGASPLHFAAAQGHARAVETLLERGAPLDGRNLLGQTALHRARENGHQEVSELLVRRGADPGPPVFPVLKGDYLGQEPPGSTPAIFAPGLVSSYEPVHGCVTFSPDGNLAYWSIVDFARRGSRILGMRRANGRWQAPEPASFGSSFSDDVPFFAPDGRRVYFLSTRPLGEASGAGKENIWYAERAGDEWTPSRPVGPEINSMDLHWQFSVSRNGNLYFASSEGGGKGLNDIYVARRLEGRFSQPENLGDSVNSEFPDFAPLISPDERFLVFSSVDRPDGVGEVDLYISFRSRDGGWTRARNLGRSINTGAGELLSTLSPDGGYLFFTGRREGRKGVFWVDAGALNPSP